MQNNREEQDYREKLVYWFVILDSARERDDFEAAAEAKRQLERLGVRIAFRRRRREGVTV